MRNDQLSGALKLFTTAGILLSAFALASPESAAQSEAPLVRGFRQPPDETKPWVYWYWATDNVSREGITRDLESMARVGIGEALIGNVFLPGVRQGSVKVLSEEWWSLVEHAIREGGRLGVNIGMFNCPGWSQSGGPWVKPGQAMRYVVVAERRVTGPARFEDRLPTPTNPFQEIAVLAFPAPRDDTETIAAHSPRVTCTPAAPGAPQMCDGDPKTVCRFPPGAAQGGSPITIDVELSEPFTARSLLLHPSPTAFAARCALLAEDEQGSSHTVRSFLLDRSLAGQPVNVGPMPDGPIAVSFPPARSRRFRLVLTEVRGEAGLAEIGLSAAARLERFVEKQLGVMHRGPLPMWDTYLWPEESEPDAPELAVPERAVVDLTARSGSNGTLRWDVPDGEWIILRAGMALTGTTNMPAAPEARGLEVDKMNRESAEAHIDAHIGKLVGRMPEAERRALKHVVADSYEVGPQNWTDRFGEAFRDRYGYDARSRLPVLTGRIVGSADQSNRFLWDLRRLVADRIAADYVGGLRDACHRHGLKLWLQNYGHWGFPAESLQYGGRADHISGEFWADGELGSIEVRAASSASHIYGMPITTAEAFTGGPPFLSSPWSLKRRGDWAATEGANHFALHLFFHQPSEDRRPGVNAWFGTEFNRHNTWFGASRSWIDYLRSSHFLLQHGRHVADVACFIGEDAPKMTGPRRPEFPGGYDFDQINAEVIEQRLQVQDGRFVLPSGTSYRILALPELDTMRPELLRRLRDLVAAGGAVLGSPPVRSPSLQNYPACDAEVRRLAAELWANCDGTAVKHVRFGKGHVFRGLRLQAALEELKTPPDVAGLEPKTILWTHRASSEADIYFLSNQSDDAVSLAPVFRVLGKAPELWSADRRKIVRTAAFEATDVGVRVPVELDPGGSVFVVFRESAPRAPIVTEVTCDAQVVLTTAPRPGEPPTDVPSSADVANTFTMAFWVKPDAEIALPTEADSGVFTELVRNDAVSPLHGPSLFGTDIHACAGVSVGRNGVAVWEHSSGYFAPILVRAAAITSWTHVAVVYQGGRPSLHLNGSPVHRGLQSRYTVHLVPSTKDPAVRKILQRAGLGAGGPFKGELGRIQRYSRALAASEIAALARLPAAAGAQLPVVAMMRGEDGDLEAEVSLVGSYRVTLADGGVRSFEVRDLPGPLDIGGPWDVGFPAKMDVPERLTFERLIPWSEHPNEAVRYFSGTATYSRTFDLPAEWLNERRSVLLDLGNVESLAEVFLNGRDLGVLWKPPFIVDVTSAARGGGNALQVRVTNTWLNRLIGDKKYPNGFPGAGPLQFKPALAYDISNLLGDEPIPCGLMGPVRLRVVLRVRAP